MTMLVLVAREKSITDKNIHAVKKMILVNCRITIREVADDVVMSFSSYQVIFTDISARIVPKLLKFEQK